jgi:hypothetical protein
MKKVKTGFAAVFLLFTISSFASVNDLQGKKKKHKCNSECTSGKHNYLHGERKHKCTEACHHMMEKKM